MWRSGGRCVVAEGETEEEEGLITAALFRREDVMVDICLEFGTRQTPRRGWGCFISHNMSICC